MIEIAKVFRFEAAHRLPYVPPGHKCAAVHGHSYAVTVYVAGELDAHGWIVDFGDVTAVVAPLIGQLDHTLLNDTIPNPTSENLAIWLFDRIAKVLPGCSGVRVSETATSWCEYRPCQNTTEGE